MYMYKQAQILYSPSCSYDFPYVQEIRVCQCKFSFPFSIRQNYNLCQLCLILPTLLPQTLAYTLPVLMSLFPSLFVQFSIVLNIPKNPLSPNPTVILCNILVFCHPTPFIECHPFLLPASAY